MYYPIIKNKLNELKGLALVNPSLDFIPIIELVECKYDGHQKFFENFMSKIASTLQTKNILVDLPTYTNNEVISKFELDSAQNKFDFFEELKNYFLQKQYKPFIPVISFDYSYGTQRECYKENLKFVKKISSCFSDGFAFRLFSDSSYKNDDKSLVNQAYAFLDESIIEKCHIIIDCDEYTFSEVIPIVKELTEDYPMVNLILAGEAFNGSLRKETSILCGRIKNHQLDRVTHMKHQFVLKDLPVKNINYSDFTLLEKIQSKIEIDPDKGFLYYPFIKFTTEDGNQCMFTADSKGNYHQYEELCQRIRSHIKNFSRAHCETCAFIDDVALMQKDLKFKAGSTWKYRMIGHHITALAMLGV
ncbi:MAG: hypothetical protein AB7E13_08200 [Arcobacteraceae bacterium]